MRFFSTTKKGFTLIELLVVIAIIGLLAGIVVSSLNSARVKSRDAVRLASLKNVASALALYFNDHNDTYPDPNYGGAPWGVMWTDQIMTALNGYISPFQDPLYNAATNPGATYYYCGWDNFCVLTPGRGIHYLIGVYLENPSTATMASSVQGNFMGGLNCGQNNFYCIKD